MSQDNDVAVDISVEEAEAGGCSVSIIVPVGGEEPSVLTIDFDADQRRRLGDALGSGSGYLRRGGKVDTNA